ncbi:NUDIX domain-containing protein [Cyanobium sp. N.Huapi 1H5]|uniref:NUDIX hydrolase n=1 Tax=Cyanobium sp. N.Huapi 1H5 TaxID=2823719 RepID=UPI0020CD7144|nr:NUDIX domain-containing protein [Cyanobium sp. N.Huapi 1H5]MCP9837440.1 NUDIX domain-containing protein [Cyanobium sp. N.Huapi 1H5]
MLIHEIQQTLEEYQRLFPSDTKNLHALTELVATGANLSSRSEFRGHVTCGAIVLNSERRLLMVHHRALDKWLFPGGHLEETDATLRQAALRELAEETGVLAETLSTSSSWVDDIPVHIDRHLIPQNAIKGEPSHFHYDFRYIFLRESDTFVIQDAEVADAAWVDPMFAPKVIRDRLEAISFLRK